MLPDLEPKFCKAKIYWLDKVRARFFEVNL